MQPCPCGKELSYQQCCSQFIDGSTLPQTPEELMRSRYTAYTQANIDYIVKTMLSPAADDFDPASAKEFAKRCEWLKLEIFETSQQNTIGFVEFLAHFSQNKKRHVIHEKSEFHLMDGKWYYVDGTTPPRHMPVTVSHIGRNESCLCGSGKKYKKCCGSC